MEKTRISHVAALAPKKAAELGSRHFANGITIRDGVTETASLAIMLACKRPEWSLARW